jgi:hypothetical protein
MDLRNIMRWNVEPDDSRAQDWSVIFLKLRIPENGKGAGQFEQLLGLYDSTFHGGDYEECRHLGRRADRRFGKTCWHVAPESSVYNTPTRAHIPEDAMLQILASQDAINSMHLITESVHYLRPPLWSSGQSSWLQIRRSGFDSRHYQKKK